MSGPAGERWSPGHWAEWHSPYDDPTSALSRRLQVVQARILQALDLLPAGPLTVLSLCAGQGRDLLPVLLVHPRGRRVTARLVELDQDNVAFAQDWLDRLDLPAVTVVRDDASTTSAAAGAVPADLLLLCGIFGNVSDDDIGATIDALPTLCAPGAVVIWTRHRRAPDATPTIRRRFVEAGFEELGFDAPDDAVFGVGTNRMVVAARPFVEGRRLFTFTGDGDRPA